AHLKCFVFMYKMERTCSSSVRPAYSKLPRLKGWQPFQPIVRPLPRTIATSSPVVTVTEPSTGPCNHQTDVGSPPVSSSAAPATVPAPAAEPAGQPFPWFSHWYPVAVLSDLDPRRPHATHLLGIPLALWRDAQGQWRAVEDRCPHRLAPLSEGRVEADGSLQCAYHGWQFDGRGACTHIPQLRGDERAQGVACASRRACVRAFPCQQLHGLLWVLPDASEQGWSKAAQEPVPSTAIKELMGGPEAEGWRQTTQWYARDVPNRFDTLVENLIDPSHVPFAHHGVQGRRESEKGTVTKLFEELTAGGFSFDYDPKNPRFPPSRPMFRAPTYIRYGSKFRTLNAYGVPTRPGWSRVYATFTKDTRSNLPLPWFINAIYSFIESTPWLEHLFQRHLVLEGDAYMLHVQERLLLQEKGNWKDSFYMPAPADSSVIAMRRWLDEFGGRVPTCEPDTPMPPQMSKRQVLDRYSQHTQHCSHCKKALRNIEL
ncbi:hypothetical protein Agub_g3466, partial [Astrephomene gubernaculifera]